jgi:hypothetical protein
MKKFVDEKKFRGYKKLFISLPRNFNIILRNKDNSYKHEMFKHT